MPGAKFYCHDLKEGIPEQLQDKKFKYIVSSYVFHHLDDGEKVEMISSLLSRNLEKDGVIIIADIAFKSEEDLQLCREEAGHLWDDGEYYMVGSCIVNSLCGLGIKGEYRQLSKCAGVLEIVP